MTQCNCKNTDELRIVRGNAFAIRLTVSAIHIDGTPVENFVLGESEAVLKVMHLDEKTPKEFLVIGNDAIISFDGTQPLGWYGFEMTGEFNGKPWRWCVPQVFQIVETNAKANVPAWAMLTDETYAINGVMTITSGDIYQSDWDETDPQSPSYIKNKPTKLADFNQDSTHRVVSDEQIDAWNNKYDKPSGGIPKSDLAQSVQESLDDADSAYQKPSGGIPATDLAGDIPESKLDQSTQDKIDAGNSAYQLPSGGIPKSDLAQGVQESLDDADSAYQKPSGGIPATDLAGDIPESKLDQSTQDKIDAGDSAYQLPSGGIPKSDLAQGVQDSLDDADTAYQKPAGGIPATDLAGDIPESKLDQSTQDKIDAGNSAYQLPSGGIPKSDLAQSVQDSLDDADTAYQKPAGGIPATDLAGDIPESKLDQSTQEKIDAGNSAYQLPSGGIPKSDLAQGVQDSLDDADTAYQKPSGGIPATDLAGNIPESKLDQSTQEKIDAGNSAYQLPSGGIPKSDLDSSVQTSLGKADTAIQDVTQIENDIDNIEKLIPQQATPQNQLADKEFVNSSIATATATYRGAYNEVSDLSLTTAATEQQIAAALATKMAALSIEPDNNDYCFVQIPTADATPTQIARVDRYKYNGTAWSFEFSLNNSGFTAAQWAALNSGITSGLVTKLSDLPTNSELTTLLNGKADKSNTYTKTEIDNKIGDLGNTAPVYYTQAEADAYNAELDGALNSTDALTAEQAAAYNAAITGASKEAGDTLSEEEANAYNATLEGAVSTSDVKIPSAPKSVKQYVDDGLGQKQDTLTFDNTPTENSNNPVKSGGIYASQAVQDARIAALEKLHEDGADYIYIDETIEDPMTRVYGDVNGPVIQWIRKNSHRYLGKRTADGVMTVCQLDDANSNLYAEDGSAAVLTGAEGDVFMWLPEFYTETVEVGTKLWRIGFSKKSLGTGWHKWKNDNLVGIYEASVANDKAGNSGSSNDGNGILRSVSGTASKASVSQANFKTKARNKGAGYSLVLWRQHCIMAVLYYAEYGNTNCQGSIGSGTNSNSKATGQTDALGMKDTVNGGNGSSGSINFWGLENWWGNKAEWIDNVEVNPLHEVAVVDPDTGEETGETTEEPMIGVWRITEDDGTIRDVQGSTTPLNSSVYAQNLIFGENLDIIARGDQEAGTSSTNYCDSIYTSNNGSRVVFRSYYRSSANGGVAYSNTYYDSSSAYTNDGSRLAFHGQIVKAESVAAFKAALDYVGEIESESEESNG